MAMLRSRRRALQVCTAAATSAGRLLRLRAACNTAASGACGADPAACPTPAGGTGGGSNPSTCPSPTPGAAATRLAPAACASARAPAAA